MSIVTVSQDYAKVLLDHLELEITDELKKKLGNNNVRLSILLDKKGLELDEEDFPSDSKYVIAYDSTNVYHLCIGYVEDDGKRKKENVESLAKATKIVKEQKGRELSKLDKEIKQKKKAKELLQNEYDEMLEDKKNLTTDISVHEYTAEYFLKQSDEAAEEYEKLVGKIERLRKNFLIRVLFHIYKLELD